MRLPGINSLYNPTKPLLYKKSWGRPNPRRLVAGGGIQRPKLIIMAATTRPAAALLLLSGATALQLQLPHAPGGLLASRRGAAFVSRHQARGVQMNDGVLTEENVEAILAECQIELGTLFGSNDQSRKVGITGVRH